MIELVFATHNKHKLAEAEAILGEGVLLLNLDDIGANDEIEETADSIEGNARLKAQSIAQGYSVACFADDTGLEVEALNGQPGVKSARYAGEPTNSQANIEKLLSELKGQHNRRARFRTVVSLIINGKEHLFEGIVNGHITEEARGHSGFGYDPVFVPEGETRTFAELSSTEKNKQSHRALALQQMALLLQNESYTS